MLALVVIYASILAATLADQNVLVANENGVHIVEPNSQNTKTIIPIEVGANSVVYSFENRKIYGILKSQNPMGHGIFRTEIVDETASKECKNATISDWCRRHPECLKICSSPNPHKPELTLTRNCWNASNLVFDWINKNHYWTCDPKRSKPSSSASLQMATWEGKNNVTVLEKAIKIQSVEVDPFQRYLFILTANELTQTSLEGKNEKTLQQFDSRNEDVLKISLDDRKMKIYVVGKTIGADEYFMASLNYDGSEYQKLFTTDDPAWRIGPKIVNSVVYWLANRTDWRSVEEEDVKMVALPMHYDVTQWSLMDVDAQRPVSGSYCSNIGCSHECTVSAWISVICQCPAGMTLANDNKTCNGVPTSETHATRGIELSTVEGLDGPHGVEEPSGHVTTDPLYSTVADTQNATVMTAAVTASSSSMALFYIVVTTICVSVFVVVVVVKRRGNIGNYQPAGSSERTDFSL